MNQQEKARGENLAQSSLKCTAAGQKKQGGGLGGQGGELTNS